MNGEVPTGRLECGFVSSLHGPSATASSRPHAPCSTLFLLILGWQSHSPWSLPGHEKIPSVSTEHSKGCRAGGLKLELVLICGHSEKTAKSMQRKQDSALSKLVQEEEGLGGKDIEGSYRLWWKTSQKQKGGKRYFQDHKPCLTHAGERWHLSCCRP